MSSRLILVPLGALMLVLPGTARAANTNAQAPIQESGNPINDQGSSYH